MIYDDVMRRLPDGPPRRALKAALSRTVLLKTQNVADYYWESTLEFRNWRRDFPCLRAPWPAYWMEWRIPLRLQCGDGSRLSMPVALAGDGIGVLAVDGYNPWRRLDGLPDEPPDAAAYLSLAIYSRRHGFAGVYTFQLQGDGSLLEDGQTVETELNPLGRTQIGPALLCTSLCHCKNVVVIQKAHDPRLLRARESRGRIPTCEFYTLRIQPCERYQEDPRAGAGADLPLSIVRGHFKRFTPDRPLFGKWAGLFWWPMHTRGSIENGAVVKAFEPAVPV